MKTFYCGINKPNTSKNGQYGQNKMWTPLKYMGETTMGTPIATRVYEQYYMALRKTRLTFLQRNWQVDGITRPF